MILEKNFIKKFNDDLKANVNLSNYSWFNLGGNAEYFYKAKDKNQLIEFLREIKEKKLKITTLGAGSNTLIRDKGVKGVVIKLGNNFSYTKLLEKDILVAGAATLDRKVASFAKTSSLGNLEFLSCIPGSIGGAIIMNSGCYENDISTSSVCETKNTTTAPSSTPTLTTAEINAMNDTFLIQQEEIYDALVFDADAKVGYRKSHDSREKLDKDEDSSSFYYGEIRFSIFAKAIHKIKTLYNGLNKDGGVFYDLGSGSGKMVLAAALLYPFSKSIGIEYLSDLHDLSQILVQRYYKSKKRNNTTSVLTKLGDICDETFPWFEDADVIYCNMLAFEEELLHKVRELLKRVRPGTFVLTTGKFIISVVCSLICIKNTDNFLFFIFECR